MKISIPKNSLSDALDTFGKMLSAKDMIAVRSDGKNAVLAGQGHEAALSMMLTARVPLLSHLELWGFFF